MYKICNDTQLLPFYISPYFIMRIYYDICEILLLIFIIWSFYKYEFHCGVIVLLKFFAKSRQNIYALPLNWIYTSTVRLFIQTLMFDKALFRKPLCTYSTLIQTLHYIMSSYYLINLDTWMFLNVVAYGI